MLTHGYVPSKRMKIVPSIKDKKGHVTDKDNYHPITITSVVSKLVELILLECLQNELGTTCNQFGSKKKLGACLLSNKSWSFIM